MVEGLGFPFVVIGDRSGVWRPFAVGAWPPELDIARLKGECFSLPVRSVSSSFEGFRGCLVRIRRPPQ